MSVTPVAPPVEQNESAAAQKHNLLDLLSRLSKWKEGAILLGSAMFVLGYITIFYNARANNLGFIPPLQAQCFLAGFFPAIVLIASVLFAALWWAFEDRFVAWYVTARYRYRALWGIVGILAMYAYPQAIMFDLSADSMKYPSLMHNTTYAALFLFLTAASIRQKLKVIAYDEYVKTELHELEERMADFDDEAKQDFLSQRRKDAESMKGLEFFVHRPLRLSVFLPLLWLLYVAAGFWLNYAYPRLPQEFGGGRARIAFVAVTRAQLSPEMRQALLPASSQPLPADPSKDGLAVAQTVLLDVVYENNDALVVRAHEEKLPQGGWRPTVYQIKKASITGVTWRGFDDRK